VEKIIRDGDAAAKERESINAVCFDFQHPFQLFFVLTLSNAGLTNSCKILYEELRVIS
jgi:hypothetical protein